MINGNDSNAGFNNHQQLKTEVGIAPYEERLIEKHLFDKVGGEYRALCPWHEGDGGNHNPSLTIYKTKDGDWRYHCKGTACDKGGDVISFVQSFDNVSFKEALSRLRGDEPTKQAVPEAVEEIDPERVTMASKYLTDHGVDLNVAKDANLSCMRHRSLGTSIAFPYDTGVVKYRTVDPNPANPTLKYLHATGHKTDSLLYNLKATAESLAANPAANVYVTESERDCLTMLSHGYLAVSVSSATTVLAQGKLKIAVEDLQLLNSALNIIVVTDMDDAGQRCADTFENCEVFEDKVKRIIWPFVKRNGDPKDIGDLYLKDPANFKTRIDELTKEAVNRPPKWRQVIRGLGELDRQPVKVIIEDFLQEGRTGIGSLAGTGKTNFCLSMASSLITGEPFLGRFRVLQQTPVLYLVPELSDSMLARQGDLFRITHDPEWFACMTMNTGILPLNHPYILSAVKHMRPVVFIDTAVRFSTADDENSAIDNRWMNDANDQLLNAGAVAVVMNHHSPKGSRNDAPTLENTFRGTTDFGAVFDVAYSLRRDEELFDNRRGPTEVIVTNVKAQFDDIVQPPPPFRVGYKYKDENGVIRSYINERHNLVMLDEQSIHERNMESIRRMIEEDPNVSAETMAKKLSKSKGIALAMIRNAGYSKPNNKAPWQRTLPEVQEETINL